MYPGAFLLTVYTRVYRGSGIPTWVYKGSSTPTWVYKGSGIPTWMSQGSEKRLLTASQRWKNDPDCVPNVENSDEQCPERGEDRGIVTQGVHAHNDTVKPECEEREKTLRKVSSLSPCLA